MPPARSRVVGDFEEVVQICRDNTLVADRLEGTGRLAAEVARDFGVVGYVARSCGVAYDARRDLPFAAYEWIDALARTLEDNIIPDFPLCNKSFNASYSGNDL